MIRRRVGFVVVWVGLATMLAACGPVSPSPTPAPPAPTPTLAPTATLAPGVGQPTGGGSSDGDDAVAVVARVQPAVVTVVNGQTVGSMGATQTRETGSGTGFIIDTDGHVVTNNHVVAGGDSFKVIMEDGSARPATLVGADPLSDLAVVKIDGQSPAVVGFGDSDALKPGQPVLAIGSPLGEFTGTVTNGIVSALNRDFPEARDQGEPAYSNLIQHNAAINPGNSGGPLFDMSGRVIGVNTLGIQTAPDGSPAQGLFFAIPSNTVVRIVDQLIKTGHVIYPFMGITYSEITPDLATLYNLPVNFGAYVQTVSRNGPAARGGIQPGDIITSLGGRQIDSKTSFSEALFASAPGDTVEVVVLRDGQQQTVQVTLQQRQD